MLPTWPPRHPDSPRRIRDPSTDARPARTVAARPAAGLARPRPGHGSGRRSHAVEPRDGGAPRRAEPGPAPGRHPRHRSAARGRRRRDRQDAGHHAADRLAHRDAPGEAVGDPGADLHGQGRRGDGGPGRPARAVRLHGHRDLHLPRVRRRPDPRARARARPADRPARAVATRGGHLPARAPVRVRPRRLPSARRSDPLPGRPGHPLQPVQGRGHRAGRLPGSCGSGRTRSPSAGRGRGGRGGRVAREGRRWCARGGRPAGRAGPCLRDLPAPDGRQRLHRFRRPGRARPAARPDIGLGARCHRRPVSLHPGRRVPGHQPGAGRAGRGARRGPPQRDRRR